MITKIRSVAPKCLFSFKSQVEQFIVVASNSTLGATGLADLLICMSLYVEKILRTGRDGHIDFLDSQWEYLPEDHLDASEESAADRIWTYVKETIVSLIYTLNQPMRGNQSPFTNISLYDSHFLEELCRSYTLDGREADPEIVKEIQRIYMEVMNEELRRTPVTFPVTTACFSVADGTVLDADFRREVAEANLEWGFINIYCGKTSTLSSCCRLRSDTSSEYFNSFGAGSTKIGSLGVVTLNLPRCAWKADGDWDRFKIEVTRIAMRANQINEAKRQIIKKKIDANNMPLYTHGHMDLSKQYSTIGVTGMFEALEILGLNMVDDEAEVLDLIDLLNACADYGQRAYDAPHNLEQVPAESSSIKLADKDYELGFNQWTSRTYEHPFVQTYPYYSNQFIPLTAWADMLDRIRLQGLYDEHFSGGAICHVNVEERLEDASSIELLIDECARRGVLYWAINYNLQECENGHMDVGLNGVCHCGGKVVNNFTRVVGFLTNVNNWNKVRRQQDYPKRQFY